MTSAQVVAPGDGKNQYDKCEIFKMNSKTKLRSLLHTLRHPAPSSKLQLVIVTGKDFNVPWAFVRLIQRRVAEMLPFLQPDLAYTPVQLVGSDIWSELNSGEARMAVLVLADMVKRGELALTFANPNGGDAAMTPTPYSTTVTFGARK